MGYQFKPGAAVMYQENQPTPEQLALRDKIREQYPHLIERSTLDKDISDIALGAKNIKLVLAKEFPGVKFSAKSSSYSGGNTISVNWINCGEGPTGKRVGDLVEQNFSKARFDGMSDSTRYDKDPWRKEFRAMFGYASYVHCQASILTADDIAENNAAKQKRLVDKKAKKESPRAKRKP